MTDETTAAPEGVETAEERRLRLASHAVSESMPAAELVSFAHELQHEVLRLRDELAGANAAAQAVRERFEGAARTDLGAALARIDELEDQKEALRSLLNAAYRDVNEARDSAKEQVRLVQASSTWRLGRLALTPVRIIRRGAGR